MPRGARFPTNTVTGMLVGQVCREQYKLIEADLREGLSAEEIVRERFPETPHESMPKWGLIGIPLLREAGVFPGKSHGQP